MKHVRHPVLHPSASRSYHRRKARSGGCPASSPGAGGRHDITAESDRKIIGAVGEIAAERGVPRAQIALAWLWRNAVVGAPIIGALKLQHIDDAIAARAIRLTDDEVARLEAHYTPRLDNQGNSDPMMPARAVEAATGFKTAA